MLQNLPPSQNPEAAMLALPTQSQPVSAHSSIENTIGLLEPSQETPADASTRERELAATSNKVAGLCTDWVVLCEGTSNGQINVGPYFAQHLLRTIEQMLAAIEESEATHNAEVSELRKKVEEVAALTTIHVSEQDRSRVLVNQHPKMKASQYTVIIKHKG